MKRFQFKFAPILKQRKVREEQALRALGDAQRAYQEELHRKQKMLFDLEQALLRREGLGSSEPVGALSFQLEEEFIQGTKRRIARQDQAIVRASKTVSKALREYLAARKQTRMMEVLREKAYAEYRRERAKWEQKNADDLTVMRARLRGTEFGEEHSA